MSSAATIEEEEKQEEHEEREDTQAPMAAPSPREMMMRAFVQELRARLGAYHDALRHLGRYHVFQDRKGKSYWWVSGDAVGSLRDAAEALALLRVLSCVDRDACAKEIRAIWPYASSESDPKRRLRHAVMIDHSLAVNFSHDLAAITDRDEPPSDRFRDDFGWLQDALRASGDHLKCCCASRPVSVRVHVALREMRDLEELVDFLLQTEQNVLVHHVTAEDDQASVCSQFKIVEVRFPKRQGIAANHKVLACVARLAELGVRIPTLMPIGGPDMTNPLSRVSVARSLQALLLPHPASSTEYACVQAYASSIAMAPSVLSAVQVNRQLAHVDILCKEDLDYRDYLPGDAIQDAPRVWRWAAYAIFIRHAQHGILSVTLNLAYLDGESMKVIEQVLRSEHPLATLFETPFGEDQWLSASRFLVGDPRNHKTGGQVAHFEAPAALHVRVIERADVEGVVRWRVLLPGCGDAWVDGSAAAEVPPDAVAVNGSDLLNCELIKLDGLGRRNSAATVSLLALLSARVRSLEVQINNPLTDAFDLSQWLADLIDACSNLNSLDLPRTTKVSRLGPLVAAAKAKSCRLRSLRIHSAINLKTGEVIEFLDVLGDASHQLTMQLEDLFLSVVDNDNSTEFNAAWQRMLERNRRLRTISLFFAAYECVEQSDEPVVVRTGPLPLARKVAILSVVDTSGYRLDNSVLAVVFEFAAEGQVRNVTVSFEELDAEGDEAE